MVGELCACVRVCVLEVKLVVWRLLFISHFFLLCSIIAIESFVHDTSSFCMVIFFYELAQLFKTDGCILTVLDKTRMLLHPMHGAHVDDVINININIDASMQFLSTMST